VPWQNIIAHRLVRWVGILLVAAIAALVSYRHLRGLLIADGEDSIVYTMGPLAVDGLMLMSTLGLLLTRATAEKVDELPVREDFALLATIKDLENKLAAQEALLANLPMVPESREVEQYAITTGNGKSEMAPYALADLLPTPVSAPPAIPGLQLGEVQPLPGWTPPASAAAQQEAAKTRAPRKAWDETRARVLLLEGRTKGEVATEVDVDPKTIQRLRAKMIRAGELTA
jgi:hypothetical protein